MPDMNMEQPPMDDPNMGGEQPPMDDPNMGGEQPPMDDPNMGGEQPPMDDPTMGEEQPPMDSQNTTDDSTESILKQLSDTDREAVRAYAQSMLSRDETQDETPMSESFIFTKNQLDKLYENFGPTNDELVKTAKERKPAERKTHKSKNPKSPFNSPKFN